jgi:hypothetical protein
MGVFRFVNDPRKGCMKSPGEGCRGVFTGTWALVSNTISGTFDSATYVTRAVYSILRNCGRFEEGEEKLTRPSNICSGIWIHGLGGCISEICEGLYSCFTKPCKKVPGGKSCAPRTGNAFLNCLISPATGAIRWTNASTAGTANCFKKEEKQNDRYRHPRQFGLIRVMKPYKEDQAFAEECFATDQKMKYEQIVYFCQVNELTVVVVTKSMQLVVYRRGKHYKKVEISEIERFERYYLSAKRSMNIVSQKKSLAIANIDENPLNQIQDAINALNGTDVKAHDMPGENPNKAKQCCSKEEE